MMLALHRKQGPNYHPSTSPWCILVTSFAQEGRYHSSSTTMFQIRREGNRMAESAIFWGTFPEVLHVLLCITTLLIRQPGKYSLFFGSTHFWANKIRSLSLNHKFSLGFRKGCFFSWVSYFLDLWLWVSYPMSVKVILLIHEMEWN